MNTNKDVSAVALRLSASAKPTARFYIFENVERGRSPRRPASVKQTPKAGIHFAMLVTLCLGVPACGNDDDSGTDTSTNPDDYNPDCTAFVDGDVDKSGDGWSWESAVKTVQEGIDLAHYGATEVGICEQWEVWVKQGTYYIYQDSRENTVQLKENVALLGGFDGTETAEFDRDWEANVTTLNGRDGPDGENHVYNVVTGSDDATLDGFTVTGGRADEEIFDSIHCRGGGMTSWNASPTISNCVFEGNSALIAGGGIDVYLGTVTISDSTFSNNSASAGGAIAMYESSVTFTDVDFLSNTVQASGTEVPNTEYGSGAGIYIQSADAVVTRCKFTGNISYGRGGGLNIGDSVVFLEECEFLENMALLDDLAIGGGINIGSTSNVDIINTLFEDNGALFGGGVIVWGSSSLDVTNSTFRGNDADAEGGGLQVVESTAVVSECTFEDNAAPLGGGATNWVGSSTYTNCVFAGNGNGKTTGGGIYSAGASTQATNCTFYNNTAEYGAALYSLSYYGYEDFSTLANSIAWNNSQVEIEWDTTSPTVTFSDIQGGFEGEGNIDLDPLFVDASSGDLHLQSKSPCVGAASPEAAPETDFDGNPRDDEPDMGAYEVQ